MSGSKPLIYDKNIHAALAGCADLAGLAPAAGRPVPVLTAVVRVAHEAAKETDDEVAEADIEVVPFAYAQCCGNDDSCGLTREVS